MADWLLRFVQAGDFHLELPLSGLAEIPPQLRDVLVDAPFQAAEGVFHAALSEGVDFLVLCGDLLDAVRTGPRGPRFLQEQFERLAEREIAVYWAGGPVDPVEAWPEVVPLPENVHRFPTAEVAEFLFDRGARPPVRLLGRGRGEEARLRPGEFRPPDDAHFTIAVAHGKAPAAALERAGVDAWALGGRHTAKTLRTEPAFIHYAGSPQGRKPTETGPHGGTLVEVDGHGRVRQRMLPTNTVRWCDERIVLPADARRSDLEHEIDERTARLTAAAGETELLIRWTILAEGPLLTDLRRGTLAVELVNAHRTRSAGRPGAWSVDLVAGPAGGIPDAWYRQESVRGDFLRSLAALAESGAPPIGEDDLPEGIDAELAEALLCCQGAARSRLLEEAAQWGADRLTAEGGTP